MQNRFKVIEAVGRSLGKTVQALALCLRGLRASGCQHAFGLVGWHLGVLD